MLSHVFTKTKNVNLRKVMSKCLEQVEILCYMSIGQEYICRPDPIKCCLLYTEEIEKNLSCWFTECETAQASKMVV